MRRIALFVEDYAHQQFIGALIERLAHEYGVAVTCDWRNVRHGHGAVIKELRQFLRDMYFRPGELPDLVLVATDANCKGLVERTRMVTEVTDKAAGLRIICAIPDPHIERWFLLDSAAFKAVFGRGCDAPDQKCERSRYKKMLIDAIRQSDITPSFGGIEFAEAIVKEIDLSRIARLDNSIGRLLNDLSAIFREWCE
jgi:hypothetical protein